MAPLAYASFSTKTYVVASRSTLSIARLEAWVPSEE